jgi:hypothetical protein
MSTYKVRCYEEHSGWTGLFAQSDSYADYTLTSPKSFEDFAQELAARGFQASDTKWIMPGAIIHIVKIQD